MSEKDDKTEKPSAHTLKKARERGEVAQSSELTTAILLAGGLLMLWGLNILFNERLEKSLLGVVASLSHPNPLKAIQLVFRPLIVPVGLFLMGSVVLCVVAPWMQSGGILFKKRVRGKKKSVPRVFYMLLKIGVMALIGFLFIWRQKPMSQLVFASSFEKVRVIFHEGFYLALALVLALLVLGLGDFFYQKWRWYKQLHMTKQQAKDEQKEIQGNTLMKGHMRKRK